MNKYSNCLLESVKEYVKSPNNIKIHKKGSWFEIFKCKFPHFYWLDLRDNHYYHFCARFTDEPFLYQLWFQGDIKRFLWHGNSDRIVEE